MLFHGLSLLALLPLAIAKTSKYNTDYKSQETKIAMVKSAMLASIRTSWEQGVAADSLAELDYPAYSVYGPNKLAKKSWKYSSPTSKDIPLQVIQFGLSAAVRQSPDGRLSQQINDGTDGASLDGASAGIAVITGMCANNSYSDYLGEAARKQLNYVLYSVPRSSTGAISHRATTKDLWADAVYVGFPFIAAYGAVTNNQTLLQLSYDQCRLYRDSLRLPEAGLWAHIWSDDRQHFDDKGLWATGNAWAAKGILNVAVILNKSGYNMTSQVSDLKGWVKEILNGTFTRLDSDNLVPNYMDNTGSGVFGDASASALLSATAYRAAIHWPADFGDFYIDSADKIRESVLSKITDLGLLSPIVDPLSWNAVGLLGTEAQAFGLMMYAGWRDWVQSATGGVSA